MENNKTIYLKEALANKKPSEILDMMPFMVCIEEFFPERRNLSDDSIASKASVRRNSYEVIGVTKTSILLGTTVYSENDDDFGWSPYIEHDSYIELPLDKLDNRSENINHEPNRYKDSSDLKTNYVFCHECTAKQKNFLVKYCDFEKDDKVSGYEAFHLIQEKTNQWQKQKQKKKERGYNDPVLDILEGMDMQDFVESGFYFDEPF